MDFEVDGEMCAVHLWLTGLPLMARPYDYWMLRETSLQGNRMLRGPSRLGRQVMVCKCWLWRKGVQTQGLRLKLRRRFCPCVTPFTFLLFMVLLRMHSLNHVRGPLKQQPSRYCLALSTPDRANDYPLRERSPLVLFGNSGFCITRSVWCYCVSYELRDGVAPGLTCGLTGWGGCGQRRAHRKLSKTVVPVTRAVVNMWSDNCRRVI